MVELLAKTPCEGLLPISVGNVSLAEDLPVSLTMLTVHKGRLEACSELLKSAHGMAMPKPNRATGTAAARAIWFGRDQAMLVGPAPNWSLKNEAAVVDQSDAWAVVKLEGVGAEDVLARLVPVNVRTATFKRGHTARTMLGHMTVSITRVGEQAFQIMAFRSMAKTLVHDLQRAMESVAARG
ncbi:MAG: sarcosine oxidase subunit gamma [Shimia sp.]|uniref:sarcosine oxidase subunit gamma n=1 Tax=Shimia sp. TaxID=1954381 RepID=UPI0025DE58BA|nr:sarcosine oxidase subunit gamma [Shimia sp.]MCH2066374.1 sarcosine oxidase subunit gamma [Shimia sp.]